MGYCRFLQDVHDTMLLSPGGCTRWVTVDGSPQGGIDWVLVGTATMKQEDLGRALALAEDLATDLPADQAQETAEALGAMIKFVRGVPGGVGSGRSALKNKMKAVTHCTRLVSSSWTAAASLMNASVTSTGDLAEAKFPRYRNTLGAMFGPWVEVGVE